MGTLLTLAITLFVGMVLGAVADAKLRDFIPMRLPSNRLRLANRKTDVDLKKLDLEEAEIARKIDQEQINHEHDRIKGHQALVAAETSHKTTMLQLEAQERKWVQPEIDVGEALRSRRKELNWTQRHLESLSKIPVRRISAIENGDHGSIEEIRRLSYQLDLVFSTYVTRPDRAMNPPSWQQMERERNERMRQFEQLAPDPPTLIEVDQI